jgi:hypothetical protein
LAVQASARPRRRSSSQNAGSLSNSSKMFDFLKNLPGSIVDDQENLRNAQPTSRDGACAVAGHFFQIPNDKILP